MFCPHPSCYEVTDKIDAQTISRSSSHRLGTVFARQKLLSFCKLVQKEVLRHSLIYNLKICYNPAYDTALPFVYTLFLRIAIQYYCYYLTCYLLKN